jgi:hypothetical protein
MEDETRIIKERQLRMSLEGEEETETVRREDENERMFKYMNVVGRLLSVGNVLEAEWISLSLS